jgi:hypothetical protein
MEPERNEHDQGLFDEGREAGKLEPRILKLDAIQKAVIGVIAILTFLSSTVGGYLVNKSMVEYRMTETEKKIAKNEAKIDQLDTFGHPDHERRLTKMEARADNSDKNIDDLNRKVDVQTAILVRIEKTVNDLQANRGTK